MKTFSTSSVRISGFYENQVSEDWGFPKPGCPNIGDCQKLQLSEILGTFYSEVRILSWTRKNTGFTRVSWQSSVFLFLSGIQFEHPYGRLGSQLTLLAKSPFPANKNGLPANKLFLSEKILLTKKVLGSLSAQYKTKE